MRYHGSSGAERIRVRLSAQDPISYAGLAGQLRPCPELRLLGEDEEGGAAVVVVALDRVGEEEVQTLRQLQRAAAGRIVLVGTELDDAGLVAAVECGVVGVVRRTEATAARLVQTIVAAARGEGTVPADLLGRLLEQVGRLQRQVLDPRGLAFTGLSAREIEVLRLVAAGHDTAEIAEALSFSERTVKNVLHEVTTRLQLRNRSHAVAYAMREGFI
ncbi:LuxR C-terminal-related transcriptional regulator [Kitasatospora atroaurantiaca]|uniref:DNA-binding NarL/FixJ family response regulator n=1 Tax=Kitasatospora atroaurantiaca TaxID=285545 RepID=A0A561EZQ8_9ACTN|nr:response regulator transcription factor [Kitasatospora atroaurantiaca]TWE21096.1 DNA-binding NarL/FixJ family response regulator [Kitasatospora atroaurantiaca]